MRIVPAPWAGPPPTLDDARWSETPACDLVDVLTGQPPKQATKARVVTTADEIAVRFDCVATTIRATMTRYKDKVWQEGAVEVYLRPPAGPVLYELQLSPIGTFRDLQVWRSGEPDPGYDDSWSCAGARVAARIHRSGAHAITGWSAMFALPWASLGPAAPDQDGWMIGLFRIERDPEEHSALVSFPADDVDFHDRRFLVPLRAKA